jgi:hypothetical protein
VSVQTIKVSPEFSNPRFATFVASYRPYIFIPNCHTQVTPIQLSQNVAGYLAVLCSLENIIDSSSAEQIEWSLQEDAVRM